MERYYPNVYIVLADECRMHKGEATFYAGERNALRLDQESLVKTEGHAIKDINAPYSEDVVVGSDLHIDQSIQSVLRLNKLKVRRQSNS